MENEASKNVRNDPTRTNCEICNIHDIHINDWQNHIDSRRHRSKLRSKNKEPLERDDSYNAKCIFCNRVFTDEKFYNTHLGTKTHRRNLKKTGVKDQSQLRISISGAIVEKKKKGRRLLKHPQDEASVEVLRKKYKIRNIKTDDLNFKSYIYSLTAYLSMRLALSPNVQDFTISVNDKDWGAFGDIVINLVYKEKNMRYAIQCKKVNQSYRQISCLEEAKLHLDKQYNHLAKLKSTGKSFAATRFVIFTTCSTSSNFCKNVTLAAEVLNKWKIAADISNAATIELKSLSKNDVINVTSDPENMYSFLLVDNVGCELPYIFFYTNQRINSSMLNQLLKLRFDNYPDISKDYVKYLENWGEGKLGGNYKLRKKDIILKIGEVLLNPFMVSPKKIQSQHSSFDIWNNVMNQMDLIVVKNELFIISKICQSLNKIIEETLCTNIDTVTRCINLKLGGRFILENLTDPIKSYFFEVVQDRMRDEVPLHLIYNVFWKAGKIPLLLCSENQEECKGFILDVILFLKQMGVNKKFLLKTADLTLNHYKEHLNIFTSLEDIKYFVNLDEIKIRVTDSFQLSLSTIYSTDPFFFKSITPNIFFDLALGRYTLKASYQGKNREKDGLKIILSDAEKEKLETNLYARTDLLRMNSTSYMDDKLRGIDPYLF